VGKIDRAGKGGFCGSTYLSGLSSTSAPIVVSDDIVPKLIW